MGFDLFSKEQKILEMGKDLAENMDCGDAESAKRVKKLAAGYGKLLKTTKKLVKISDQNEEKLNLLSKELAQKNLQLEAQTEELVKAAELKEEVEHITRHDLKNPLTNILFTPQLLIMDENLTDEQREMLKQVEESGLAMLNMINLSLDLFKMEQGTYTLQPAEVDIAATIRRIFREHGVTAETMNVPLRLVVNGEEADADTIFTVNGEELLLYSMMANLVKNALEATPEDTPITVSLSNQKGVRINVHNMGAIPEEIRDTFFDKYATVGKKMGTGLGTYSAKLIAETHGGSISFETSEENGTELTISLP